MRLLITTDTVGGVWTFTTELTRQLLQLGHSVALVSFGRSPSREQQACVDDLSTSYSKVDLISTASHASASRPHQNDVISTGADAVRAAERPPHFAGAAESSAAPQLTFTYTPTEIPLEWMQNNEAVVEQGQEAILDNTVPFRPDLILSSQFCFGRLSTPIPRVVVAHSDVLSWARACRPSVLEPTPWLNRYTSMVQAGLLDAAAVATPTASMGKALTTSFFLPRNYFVIPNGCSVQLTTEPGPQRKLQAITAGRLWDEAKGLDTLRDLTAPMPILLAGDNTFESSAQQPNWPAYLTHLGPLSQPDLHRQFRESAIYLCTSLYEPFGLAPLEAALCGCAIVARDIPSLREVWGDCAIYFTDSATLAHTLRALADDPETLRQVQLHSRRRAESYTPERMADAYLALFKTVLQSSEATSHVA